MVDIEQRPIGVTVTEKIVVHGTNKDPKLLAMVGVALALTNADDVDKMVDDMEQYKEKMSQMRKNLRKERGEGQSLKRKHYDSLIELEKFKEAWKILQSDKDALVLPVNITEGEKRDLEKKVSELEKKGDAANKRVEDLESWNNLLNGFFLVDVYSIILYEWMCYMFNLFQYYKYSMVEMLREKCLQITWFGREHLDYNLKIPSFLNKIVYDLDVIIT